MTSIEIFRLPKPTSGREEIIDYQFFANNDENLEKEADHKKVTYGSWLNNTHNFLENKWDRFTLNTVLSEYGIFNIDNTSYPDAISVTSRKVILETDKEAFFLKEKAKYCSTPLMLNSAANFQSYLSKQLDYIPKIIHTADDKPYVSYGTRFFLLTKLHKGRLFNGSINDVSNAGTALGELHRQSYNYPLINEAPQKKSQQDCEEFIGLASKLENTQNDEYKSSTLNFLSSIVNEEAEMILHIMNHGDYAPFNLVFNDEKVQAINDFDNCAIFPRVRDLADGILTFGQAINYAAATSIMRRPISTQFDIIKAKTFFNSYIQKAGSLSSNEKQGLVIEIKNRWAELMALGIVRGDFNYFDVHQASSFIKFIDNNIERVIS